MDRRVREELEADLSQTDAQIVIYLEGPTDLEAFFALLGVGVPPDNLHQDVLVKPRSSGGGRKGVTEIVDVAVRHGYQGIFGIIDGDGRPLSELARQFDIPYTGPLFSWKAYSVENLLVKTGWPSTWPDRPDLPVAFKDYAPYVALNNIHADLQEALLNLGIARFVRPIANVPLKRTEDVLQTLKAGKHLIHDYDVEDRFQTNLADFEAAVDSDLDRAHAMLDGKWLVEHLAFLRMPEPRSHERCLWEWCRHARTVGGLPEVRELWTRITGRDPHL